ncbi:MAG TPA: hypothetical protein VIH95_02570 [Acidimicrobiales bacterium]
MAFPTPTSRRLPAPGAPDQLHEPTDSSPLGGPQGNARLTGMTAAVLLALLAAEGATLLQLGSLLTAHVVIGMVLVPFVVVKLATTGWRMARYYLGSAPYRDRGAPPLLLRLLGPVVVVLTVTLFASGIALLLVPHSMRPTMSFLHKASFILWFGAMTVHVLGHVVDTRRLAPADLAARTRSQVRGAGARMWTLASCLVAGVLLALITAPAIGPWVAARGMGG